MTSATVDHPVISLIEPLPGLGDYDKFHLVALDDVGAVFSLRTTDGPDRLLILAAAAVFHPEYTPVLDDATCTRLELRTANEAAVFLVVNAGDSLLDSTVNLLAPLVVNTRTNIGLQVVLTGADFDLRAPLIPGQRHTE